jgi:HEPN/Toprim N-terminal domain 1
MSVSVLVRGLDVYAWRNEIDPTFLFLFTLDDVHRIPVEPEEQEFDGELERVHLVSSAQILIDRLDVLGIGLIAVQEVFVELVHAELEWTRRLRAEGLGFAARIELLEQLSFSAWVGLVQVAFATPGPRDAWNKFEEPRSLHALLDIWGEYADARYLLRALLCACVPDDEVLLDVSDLIDGGWVDEGLDPQQTAIEHFSSALSNRAPAVVIPEGAFDSWVLQAAIRLRYPHLVSFIRVFDFGDGAEGSAAAGIRTLKSFAAAGISNRVILVLDNDTAARDAGRALRGTKLPNQYTVLQLPTIELANAYPTVGPSGLSDMDVNGLAGSIELYLGVDVLTQADGTLSPVQWTSYLHSVDAYQGALVDKAGVQRRFRAKINQAEGASESMAEQDWTGLEAIIEHVMKALRG